MQRHRRWWLRRHGLIDENNMFKDRKLERLGLPSRLACLRACCPPHSRKMRYLCIYSSDCSVLRFVPVHAYTERMNTQRNIFNAKKREDLKKLKFSTFAGYKYTKCSIFDTGPEYPTLHVHFPSCGNGTNSMYIIVHN